MALGQAQDHCFDQALLDRSRHFWLRENVGRGLREMVRRFVQLRNRDRAAVGGVRLRAKLAGTSSRPIIALLAAARSSGVKDTEPHRQGAEDRRYHSQSSPFLEIWPSAISTPLISIDGSPGSVAKTIPARIPLGATFIIRGRLSSERYINNRCRSICVDSARNSPRFVITPSISRFRIPAKYISGSVNVRVALESIPPPLGDRGPAAEDTTQPSRTVDRAFF